MTPEVKACFTSLLSLLCQPISKQQAWQGVSVVSHVWNLDDAYGWALKEVIDTCQQAFVDPDVPITPEFADIVKEMISVGPCKADATMRAPRALPGGRLDAQVGEPVPVSVLTHPCPICRRIPGTRTLP